MPTTMDAIKGYGGYLLMVLGFVAICLPYLYYLAKKNLLNIWDKLTPWVPLILWFLYTAVVLKGKITMTNALYDNFIIMLVTLVLLYFRLIFIKYDKLKDRNVSIIIFFGILLLIVGLQLFMPYMRD